MMLHPTIAQQLAVERQRELLGHAGRYRQARTTQVTADRTRPYLLRRARAALASH
jgi:hypothetical protein